MKSIAIAFLTFISLTVYPCDYTISLYDTFGDGWNGGVVTVSVNGTPVLIDITVATGNGPEVFAFSANDGDLVEIVWTGGGWPTENEYTVYDQYGVMVVEDGMGGTEPVGTSFTASCPAPTCTDGIWNGLEEYIDCGGPDCPPCPPCGNGVMDGDEEGVDCGGTLCPPCPTEWDIDDVNGTTISTCVGTLYDSGGSAGDYSNSEDYSVTFCSTTGDPIMIDIQFNGEGCCDHIYVYDGPTTGSPQIADLIGDGSGTYSVLETYISTTDCITIRWTSDGSVTYGGFIIDISCYVPTCTDGIWNGDEEYIDCGGPDCPPCDPCANGVMDGLEEGVDCGGPDCPECPTEWNIDLVDGSTIITCNGTLYDSGGLTGDYQNSEDYSVTFCSEDGDPIIINVQFNGEGCCDHIYVYDGPTTADPQIAYLTGDGSSTYSINQMYISSGNCITIRWTSDGSVTYPGFIIDITCDMNEDPCTAWTLPVNSNCVMTQMTNAGIGNSTVPDPPCGNYNGQDAWFELTMPASGTLSINTGVADLTDMAMAIYTGPDCSNLTLVECDENSSFAEMPYILNNTITPGETVWVRVWDENGDEEGTFMICASDSEGCDPEIPLAANDCDNATPICSFNGYCGNTSAAYDPQDVPAIFCGSVENNSWLSFVASETVATLNVYTSNCTDGNGIQMEIYETTDCVNFTSVSNCHNDGFMSDFVISTTTPLTIGETYYLMIDGYGGDVCDYEIEAAEGVMTVDAFSIETGDDQVTICSGQPTQLQASGGDTYEWSPSTGLDDPNIANPTASPTTTTTYTVTVTGNPLCPVSDTATVVVTVGGEMTITMDATPSDCGACDGTATTTVTIGTAPYTYLWSDGQTTATATNLCEGWIWVTVTDSPGCVTIDSVEVGNTGGVTAGFDVDDADQCLLGNIFTFTNTGSSTGIETYGWDFGDSDVATTENATHSYAAAGVYTVTQTVSYEDCIDTYTFDIEVFEHPTVSLTPTDATCYDECDGTIEATPAGGLVPYTYLWDDPGAQTTAIATGLCDDSYSVVVTDANGCTVTDTETINEPTDIVLSVDGTDVSCLGGNDGAIDLTATGGTAPYTYAWTGGSGGTTEDLTDIVADDYSVIVTDANSCTETISITIDEPDTYVSTSVTGEDVNCYGGTDGSIDLTVTGGVNPYTYSWSDGSTYTYSSQDPDDIPAGTYNVTVTDGNGCTTTDTYTISQPATPMSISASMTNTSCYGVAEGSIDVTVSGGTPPYVYSWSNGMTSEDLPNVTGGTYTIVVYDANNCQITDTYEITEPSQVIGYTSGNQTICIDGTATFNVSGTGGTAPYTYLWNGSMTGASQTVSPTTDTEYEVVLTDVNGCTSNPVSLTVYVYDSLNVNVFTNDNEICIGEATVINATYSGGMGAPYMLTLDDGTMIATPYTVSPDATTTYRIYLNDMCTTPEVYDEVTITVNELPDIMFSSDIVDGCEPLEVAFTSWSTHDIVTYDWDFNDYNNNYSFTQNPTHVFETDGVFDIQLDVEDDKGCKNSLTISDMITVYPLPTARFDPDPAAASIIDPFIFFENLSLLADSSYWFFGDDDSSNVHSPLHEYAEVDDYLVTLVVATNHGCRDTIEYEVIIRDEFTFYAPTAFKPNSPSGPNSKFYVFGTGIDETQFAMYIYDRWGELVFETDQYSSENPETYGWDGRIKKNEFAMTGVYTWLVIYRDKNGNEHQEGGSVTLLR